MNFNKEELKTVIGSLMSDLRGYSNRKRRKTKPNSMILYQLILSHLLFDYVKALTPEMIKAKSKGYPYITIAKHVMLHVIGIL